MKKEIIEGFAFPRLCVKGKFWEVPKGLGEFQNSPKKLKKLKKLPKFSNLAGGNSRNDGKNEVRKIPGENLLREEESECENE